MSTGILCFFLFCWGEPRFLPTGAHGFYDWKVSTLHMAGDNYLYGGKEGLILFSPDGTMIKKILISEETPVPLERLIVLGVSDREILLLSSDKSVITLDHNLNFSEKKYPVMPQHLRGNILPYGYYFQDQFILRKKPPQLYQAISLRENNWELVTSLAKENPWEIIQVHAGHFFLFEQYVPVEKDVYQISVFNRLPVDRNNSEMVQVLSAEVGDFPQFHEALNFKLGIQMIGKTSDGYLVEVYARKKGKPLNEGGVEFFWDFFTHDGTFLKRMAIPGAEPSLMPVVNGSEIFFIDDQKGDVVLREFTGENGPS